MNKNEKKTPDHAVIYARYSSAGQREESIEGQVRECRAYAERHDMVVVGEYPDRALSGTTDRRGQFQKMIRDSEKGHFNTVICWKHDRFARNRYDAAIYKARLRQNGVRVVYAAEDVPEGPEGIIIESVMEGYAEYYSANLSQNVKRGLYDNALKLQTLGQAPYGLRKSVEGRYEPDPATAPIVERIFKEYASGIPAVEIYRKLNAEGYRVRCGKPFTQNSIRYILKNKKYTGLYEYADIRVEDGIPAIVNKELFEEVQKMLERHHEKPAAKKIDGGFILTGKLFCGHCGEPMTGDGGTSKTGRTYAYYTCVGRRQKKCDKKRAPKEWIEDLIVEKLVGIAQNDEIIETFADRFMIWQAKEQDRTAIHTLEDRLRAVEKSIANTMKAIDSGILSESLAAHLADLEREKEDLEHGIAEEAMKTPWLERDQVVYFLKQFGHGNVDDPAWRIYLVETFLKAAYLYDNGDLLLCLNYSGDDSKITLKIAEKALSEGEDLCSDLAREALPLCANLNSWAFFAGFLIAKFAQK